jgi:tetratricopeptide (TPR) repeat protein
MGDVGAVVEQPGAGQDEGSGADAGDAAAGGGGAPGELQQRRHALRRASAGAADHDQGVQWQCVQWGMAERFALHGDAHAAADQAAGLGQRMSDHVAHEAAGACLQQGFELHQAGRLTDAEPYYRAALERRPDFPAAWSNLGLVRMVAGAVDEAEQCQREALRLDPAFADAHNGLGLVHYRFGRVAKAEDCFRGCLRLWQDHPGAHLNLAVALQSRGRLEEAEVWYRDALRVGANAAEVYNNLSVLLRELGRVAEAEASCREALHLRPEMAGAQVNLAILLLLTGRWAEAWPFCEARAGSATLRRRGAGSGRSCGPAISRSPVAPSCYMPNRASATRCNFAATCPWWRHGARAWCRRCRRPWCDCWHGWGGCPGGGGRRRAA